MVDAEGTIHITRLSDERAPEPWMYDVTFAAYNTPGGSVPLRRVIGDDDLKRLLGDGVGVLPQFLGDAMTTARAVGWAAIPNVRLTEQRRRSLGL